ncbi:hypothetical protein [Psychrobacillus sp. FSL K6-2843]|uniref:hypothetical protein n=1 Tax=Psychrobacillus sp. FSL K6-2843 TaxID=2921549 RepID=UPI00315B2CC7
MSQDRIYTIETLQDNLHKSRFQQNGKEFTELEGGIIIGFSKYFAGIDVYAPDQNGVYDYIGDINFSLENFNTKISIHSQGINNICLNNGKPFEVKIDNRSLSNISIDVENKKAKVVIDKSNSLFDF